MKSSSGIDVRDLKSVRTAARVPSLVIGDDWVAPQALGENELAETRRKRGILSLRSSPIARKIVTFNLIAMMLLIAGILFLNPSRDNLKFQRLSGLVKEAELITDVIQAHLPDTDTVNLTTTAGMDAIAGVSKISLRDRIQVLVFDPEANFIGAAVGTGRMSEVRGLEPVEGSTAINDAIGALWSTVGSSAGRTPSDAMTNRELLNVAKSYVDDTLLERTTRVYTLGGGGLSTYMVTTPIMHNGAVVGVAAVATEAGELDGLIALEREQVLRLFLVGIAISIGLSLVLASTIANPLADLAAAAEMGREKNARKMSPTQIRIPDLTARPDEIGRLSGALRGMVRALYERIEGNEQFAADVAHEIKNPLASLRSAVGTLRITKRDDHREKMLDLIDHDVQRLDRLVSDISSASRLDSELVREEEETFDLLKMLGNLNEFLGKEAIDKGIDYITDLPEEPIMVVGLEGRLAQVFVNLITNATSFCEDGDAIRVWARKRQNRILVVVEDTGPGIPNEALNKIFQRFYSERPEGQFGNNSGLGLAISKQIVEAHGGVIWAENIRPTEADLTSEPLGARFVVGLPV
jgi:two-component system sensor histidine kinase ChvG